MNWNSGATMRWKNFDDTSSHFGTIAKCDGQTDRRTQWTLPFVCFSFFTTFLFLVSCARLRWPRSAVESTLNSSIVSYRIVRTDTIVSKSRASWLFVRQYTDGNCWNNVALCIDRDNNALQSWHYTRHRGIGDNSLPWRRVVVQSVVVGVETPAILWPRSPQLFARQL